MSTRPEPPTPPEGVTYVRAPSEVPRVGARRTPLRRLDDGSVEFVLLELPTKDGRETILSVPDALGINGDTQIGLSRANRILPPRNEKAPPDPEPNPTCKITRENLEVDGGSRDPDGARSISVNNPRPFAPLLHKVVWSEDHIHTLATLDQGTVRDCCEDFYRLATTDDPELDGITVGMNFGRYELSGASQPHFHYQVGGLSRANYNHGDDLGQLCREYAAIYSDSDYMNDYERALRRAGLVVTENDHAVAYVPISQRFKGEVQIMVKRTGVGNLRDTRPNERDALAELEYQILRMFDGFGCEALNQLWTMTRFSTENTYGQRLVISMYPRTSIIALYELSGNWVIDALPWAVSSSFRGVSGFSLAPLV